MWKGGKKIAAAPRSGGRVLALCRALSQVRRSRSTASGERGQRGPHPPHRRGPGPGAPLIGAGPDRAHPSSARARYGSTAPAARAESQASDESAARAEDSDLTSRAQSGSDLDDLINGDGADGFSNITAEQDEVELRATRAKRRARCTTTVSRTKQ